MLESPEELRTTIKLLSETVWRGSSMSEPSLDHWLNNFDEPERGHALHLLSQFTYFGIQEMRELLRTVYRDLVVQPLVQRIRRMHNGSLDPGKIEPLLSEALERTRFFGMGGPSESGTHLLYYFRQVNHLPKGMFPASVFVPKGREIALREPQVTKYVFFDDLCGSGTQAVQYSAAELPILLALNPTATVDYLCLFGFEEGLSNVRNNTKFNRVESIYTLDHTFKCFDEDSRYYLPDEITDRKEARAIMERHGQKLCPSDPLGYKDGQLLIGFAHNTPDNTLPVIWANRDGWLPAFPRFTKLY